MNHYITGLLHLGIYQSFNVNGIQDPNKIIINNDGTLNLNNTNLVACLRSALNGYFPNNQGGAGIGSLKKQSNFGNSVKADNAFLKLIKIAPVFNTCGTPQSKYTADQVVRNVNKQLKKLKQPMAVVNKLPRPVYDYFTKRKKTDMLQT